MFKINFSEADRLQQALENFEGNAEKVINDVLHNEAPPLAQDAIYTLMPYSGAYWNGKKAPAKSAKSLRNITGNLSVTVTTAKDYQYLYFPDDGTNTRRHIGNQQFFMRGGEDAQPEIVDLCVNKLITKFESEV